MGRRSIPPPAAGALAEFRMTSQLETSAPNYSTEEVTVANIKPLGDRVLIQRQKEAEQKTAGGIIVPDTAQEAPTQGTVIAVGDGTKDENGDRIALDVNVGDKVLFGKYSGTEIKQNGEEFLIVRETEILAVIND